MEWFKALLPVAILMGATDVLGADITPQQLEYALKQLEVRAEKLTTDGSVPGLSIAVVHKDEVVYLKGFGLREASKPELVDEDTVFQIASLSKPVSSTIVAALVSEGLVDWDSRISDLNPTFALHDPYPTQQVTVRDLFNHRSGLPGTAGDDLEDIGFSRDEIMKRLRLVPPSSSFRAGYAYSNAGITGGALAAARPTGLPWEDVAEQKLYKPLGMGSTSSRYADFVARPNKAALHIGGTGKWEAKLKRNPEAQAPAGGVSSSARDLANWLRLELAEGKFNGKPLIEPEALAATHVPLMARGRNPVTGANSFYGLGWNVEFGRYGVTWGHAGAFSLGARTVVTLYPDAQLGIVVLTNAFPTGVPEGLSDSFADLVFTGKVEKDWTGDWNAIYAGLFGPAIQTAKKTFAQRPDLATPALPFEAYVGTYGNAYVGTGTVKAAAEALTLSVGPDGDKTYPMTHFDRDTFLIFPDAEMADTPSPVTFVIGPDGKATSVTIDNLNSNGLGVLTRTEN
jgi:CubicO group peptidase (beta-lactamase class C family)